LDGAADLPAVCVRLKPDREDAGFHFQRSRNVGTAAAAGIESRNCNAGVPVKCRSFRLRGNVECRHPIGTQLCKSCQSVDLCGHCASISAMQDCVERRSDVKVVLFGATGMVRQGVLRERPLDPEVKTVLAIGRKATAQRHEKLHEIVLNDLSDLSSADTSRQKNVS
jgi:hypothetical protein